MFSLDSQVGKGRFCTRFQPSLSVKQDANSFLKNCIYFPGAEPGSCLIRTLNLDLFLSLGVGKGGRGGERRREKL